MAIRFEYGPPPSALGALAYQSGVQQAQDRRRKELEALQVQAAQMRQQRQQANLDRQFGAWKTQYGHNSAMTRMKSEYEYRGAEQDKGFTNSLKFQRIQEEAREDAARRSRLLAADQEANRYKMMGERDKANSSRSMFNKMFDEQMENMSPAGVDQAMKLWAAHDRRVSKGTLQPGQIEQDRQQMISQIADLRDIPGNRLVRGQPGWGESTPTIDGVYQRSYTDQQGETHTEYAPHPDTGWHGTRKQLNDKFLREESESYRDRETGEMVRDVTTAHVVPRKGGGMGIELKVKSVEVKTDAQKRRDKKSAFNTAFAADTEKEEIVDVNEVNEESTRTVVRVKDPALRDELIEKYGPPREERLRMLPDGGLVPFSGPVGSLEEGSEEYEDGMVDRLKRHLREEFELDAPKEAPKRRLKRGDPAPAPEPAPQPVAEPEPVNKGMAEEVRDDDLVRENPLEKREVETFAHAKTVMDNLAKVGWNNPGLVASQRVRQMIDNGEIDPERVHQVKANLVARMQAVNEFAQKNQDPVGPVNFDEEEVQRYIQRMLR